MVFDYPKRYGGTLPDSPRHDEEEIQDKYLSSDGDSFDLVIKKLAEEESYNDKIVEEFIISCVHLSRDIKAALKTVDSLDFSNESQLEK